MYEQCRNPNIKPNYPNSNNSFDQFIHRLTEDTCSVNDHIS